MNPGEFPKKVLTSKWTITCEENKRSKRTFINTEGNKYAVCEVTPCAAQHIVDLHNKSIEQ